MFMLSCRKFPNTDVRYRTLKNIAFTIPINVLRGFEEAW